MISFFISTGKLGLMRGDQEGPWMSLFVVKMGGFLTLITWDGHTIQIHHFQLSVFLALSFMHPSHY